MTDLRERRRQLLNLTITEIILIILFLVLLIAGSLIKKNKELREQNQVYKNLDVDAAQLAEFKKFKELIAELKEKNGEFALHVDPDNTALIERMFRVRALRRLGQPTIPVTLSEELRTNPFLRTGDPGLLQKFAVTEEWELLAKLRLLKDQW